MSAQTTFASSAASDSWKTVDALVVVPGACYTLIAMCSVSPQKDSAKGWQDKLIAHSAPQEL